MTQYVTETDFFFFFFLLHPVFVSLYKIADKNLFATKTDYSSHHFCFWNNRI